METTTNAADAADTLGLDGRWFDPLWRIEVELSPLERRLLDHARVRRLAHIAHAGAAALTTTQTYSRLEHSLGLLALVAHFAPDDQTSRVAALLHDVGHLPYSHTLEGIEGLDHHDLSHQRILALRPLLEPQGISPEQIIAIDEGETPSPLGSRPGTMKLDHLDSFLRSGQAHGRTRDLPGRMLRRLRLDDGTVDTDRETAAELARLVAAEARAQRSWADVLAVAVLRDLVSTALAAPDGALSLERLVEMTDAELWAALAECPATSADARRLREDPGAWQVLHNGSSPADGTHLIHRISRGYLDLPTVDGEVLRDPEIEALTGELPLEFVIRRVDRAEA
ncbi:MAG: HD domain-containing protein [Brachybacterium sp.]|uniref:HD domain-containing protein n=1 Tax=Brachybacterium sp. TaxID=1891286 RepID=UPI0026484C2F|nr:HD domain-containing protein [Brachybacterium sp.]MDN5686876.1 HD domain-containing protein [Brachybacterium sp.]